ncbi:hypothetical protein JXB41_05315 [Candidatus Woesearchaeota archaeon]|nr:hypothetical protein [Candidatus Woesearchaeota archaeon]
MKQDKKMAIIVIVLAVLLAGAIAYIAVEKYNASQTQKQLSIFQQGMQAGYEQAVLQIMQQAATCQAVPIRVQNTTLNMIAVECLQQMQAQAGQG